MMGIVFVAFLAASTVPGTATMTSTLRAISSAARSGKSSRFHAADRYSTRIFRPAM